MESNQRLTMDRDRILSARGSRSVSAYRLKRVASDIDLQKCRCLCTCGQSMFSSMSTSMTELIQRDAEGSSNTPCRLHRRSALRRVHTLTGEPGSPRTGRSNRQRSPSTPNAPDPKMLQRGLVSHLLPWP
ncbi:uncharacterized protein LOC121427558 isoform X1 [Lytechinus variegatus]|uniref:uncharacterized protein LOC121427558 isoform X1 n=1 Tax=Lytechinus variegatus TaxID=7654 RepID=UPI001BB14109|nr:uncharacterized protein LOC121427558 isoform X1 [Lytechinus variegatus]